MVEMSDQITIWRRHKFKNNYVTALSPLVLNTIQTHVDTNL